MNVTVRGIDVTVGCLLGLFCGVAWGLGNVHAVAGWLSALYFFFVDLIDYASWGETLELLQRSIRLQRHMAGLHHLDR